ncbi:unnamed protein product, partial [marine sediment metagenome]
EIIKKNCLTPSSQIQIKYGLGFLMILTFGNLSFRSRMNKDQKISEKLVLFWILISREISVRLKDDDLSLWNVYFINLPNLYKADKEFARYIDVKKMEHIIKNAEHVFNEKRKEHGLFLDFKGVN